ncbi:MAG: hypothetical protein ABWW69_06885 [Pyrodictiaceae archaeon]
MSNISELRTRIALAIKKFGAFVFQRDIDDISLVNRVVGSIGATGLLELVSIDNNIFVLKINDRGCRVECKYRVCKEVAGDECLERCLEECRRRLRNRVIDLLASS